MTYIWVMTWNIVSLCIGVPAMMLLYLIHKKMNEVGLKYLFYLNIPPMAGAFIYLILMLLLHDSQFAHPYVYALGIFNHLQLLTLIVFGIYFLHKIIEKSAPLYVIIGLPLLLILLTVEFIFRFTPKNLFNMTFPVLINNFVLAYWYFQTKKALKTITLPPLRCAITVYVLLLPLFVFLGISYVIIKNFFPHLMIVFHYFDITAFQNIVISVFIIFFMKNYYFKPSEEQKIELPQDWIDTLKLSEREAQMIPLLLQGDTAAEIGEHLHITTQTAKNYTSKLYKKIGVKNKFELMHLVQDKKSF